MSGNKSELLTRAMDFLIWQVVLTTKVNALTSSKAIAAIWARLFAREAWRTLGLWSILISSFRVEFERSEAERIFLISL